MARLRWSAVLLAGAIACGGCAASREEITGYGTQYSDDIYGDLAQYGSWMDVAPYGSVWCPRVSSTWEPYTVGYWVDTEDGWFWVSEDPWNSAPYHYGRWALDNEYGWLWVPGDVWAPAWVAWRYGSGWAGWGALPPDVSWQPQVGLDLSGYDLDTDIDRWYYTKAEDLGSTHRVRVHVEPSDKQTLFKKTRDVTSYAPGPRPIEVGMRPDLVREISDKKIERYRIVDSAKPASGNGVTIRGREVKVYRPDADLKNVMRERVAPAQEHPAEEPRIAPASIERTDRAAEPDHRAAADEPPQVQAQAPTQDSKKLEEGARRERTTIGDTPKESEDTIRQRSGDSSREREVKSSENEQSKDNTRDTTRSRLR